MSRPDTSAVARYVQREAQYATMIPPQLPISPPVSSPWYNGNHGGVSGGQTTAAISRNLSSANNPVFQSLPRGHATYDATQNPFSALYQLNQLDEYGDEYGKKGSRPEHVEHVPLDV